MRAYRKRGITSESSRGRPLKGGKKCADVLSDLLGSIRLSSSTTSFHSELYAPWGITLSDTKQPRCHLILSGHCWFQIYEMGDPIRLTAGEIVFIPNGSGHWIADSPRPERTYACDPSLRREASGQQEKSGARLMSCMFRFSRPLKHPLSGALPPYVVLKSDNAHDLAWLKCTAELIAREKAKAQPGLQALLDRFCEIFFIQILRGSRELYHYPIEYFAALKNPHINKALQLIHEQSDLPWTLQRLAQEVGLSRAVFANRFNELVGMPPKSYLTTWRMEKAADLLTHSNLPLNDIASEVGYASDTAFNRAFKRTFGESPHQYRNQRSAHATTLASQQTMRQPLTSTLSTSARL